MGSHQTEITDNLSITMCWQVDGIIARKDVAHSRRSSVSLGRKISAEKRVIAIPRKSFYIKLAFLVNILIVL